MKIKQVLKLYPSLSFMDKLKILLRLIFCIRPILEVLKANLPKQGLIVDLGCGYGIISHLISDTNTRVIGIDASSHRIKVAQSSVNQGENVEFHTNDIMEFQIPICDAIIIIDVLYLFSYDDQERILVKCYECLRDDGIMIIKDSARSPFWKYVYMCIEEWVKIKLRVYGKEIKQYSLFVWKSEDFVDILNKMGFDVLMIPLKSYLPYPGVFYICHKKQN